jgi:hypothetical protein
MKVAILILAVVFFFCVIVQYNDPDPVRWMAIYGVATLACLLFVFGRLSRLVPAATAVIALIWTASILPRVWNQSIAWNEVFGRMSMKSEIVEETREIGGLLMVAVWMLVLTILVRRRVSE